MSVLTLGIAVLAMAFATGEGAAQPQKRLAVPLPSSASAASAQVEVARIPYQAYLAANCLTGSNFCRFESEVVTNRRRLELHRIACQGWHASETPPNFVTIANLETAAGAFVRRMDFLDTRYTRVSTNSVWSISEQVLMVIPAAHRLEIALNSASTGVGSYGCTLSGYLVALGPG
jgi:hypothetical protein